MTTRVSNSYGYGVALQEDGTLVVVGTSGGPCCPGSTNYLVHRYDQDGSFRDADSSLEGTASDVLVQPNGKIAVLGSHLSRYNADLTLDAGFDGDGRRPVQSTVAVGLQNDGKILMAGNAESGFGASDFVVSRLNDDGSTDEGFGVSGKALADIAVNGSAAELAIQPNGSVIVVGTSDNQVGVARFLVSNDSDSDGVNNSVDNCPQAANAGQRDVDADGQGDVCDPDDDGDSVADQVDNCPKQPNVGQFNTDGDAFGNACDVDDDNDSVADSRDRCPLYAGEVSLSGCQRSEITLALRKIANRTVVSGK
ncbi:MAG: thrombospondin type 3 repeat-containing protein, partial [Pyrinomonadaceae bacterium]|nr:thrombospondin type 3 repeat-containing protein [Pyrinomonadaceae bacterium]